MKVPIDGYSVIDLDAPTLPAEQVRLLPGRRIRWRIWCGHCKKWHLHGPGEGHREAHSHDERSPYFKSGYNVTLKNQ